MQQQLEQLKELFITQVKGISSLETLEELKKNFLGKKWKLQDILKWIKDLSVEEKK